MSRAALFFVGVVGGLDTEWTVTTKYDALFGASSGIPRTLYQTTHLNRSCIPHLLDGYVDGLEVHVTNDEENCSILRELYGAGWCEVYNALDGAHRADMFRYAILYARGGVYLDIKTLPVISVAEWLVGLEGNDNGGGDGGGDDDSKDRAPGARSERRRPLTWFTALSVGENRIITGNNRLYNGIIATPPGNVILRLLIEDLVRLIQKKVHIDYQHPNNFFSRLLRQHLGVNKLTPGVHCINGSTLAGGEKGGPPWCVELFAQHTEKFRPGFCGNVHTADRYGYCGLIYSYRNAPKGVLLAHTRDPTYPAGSKWAQCAVRNPANIHG